MDAPFPAGMVEEIEKFLSDNTYHVEDFLIPEVFETSHFYPLQRKNELKAMMKFADKFQPETVFEIGADKGSGLLHWCKLPSVKRVIACEIRGLPYRESFEKHFPDLDFLWIEGSSYDPENIRKVWNWLDGDIIDALFIDGDKSEFLKDFDIYTPMMKQGVVFMHDIQDIPNPGNAFIEVQKRNRYVTLRLIDTTESVEHYWADKDTSNWESWLRTWMGRSCGVGVVVL